MLKLRKIEVYGDLGTAEIKKTSLPYHVLLTCDDGARQANDGQYRIESMRECQTLAGIILRQINRVVGTNEIELHNLTALIQGFKC